MTRPTDDALSRAYDFAPDEAPTRAGREPYRSGDDAGRESARLDEIQVHVDHVRRLVTTTRAPRLVPGRCIEGHAMQVEEGGSLGECRACGLSGVIAIPDDASAEEIERLLIIEIAGHDRDAEVWRERARDLRAAGGDARVLDDLVRRASARAQRLRGRLNAERENAA